MESLYTFARESMRREPVSFIGFSSFDFSDVALSRSLCFLPSMLNGIRNNAANIPIAAIGHLPVHQFPIRKCYFPGSSLSRTR